MIKPLNSPQLSAAKQRTGLQSISELLPRLIRNYELQAELMQRNESIPRRGSETRRSSEARRNAESRRNSESRQTEQRYEEIIPMPNVSMQTEQSTFSWYE